MPVAPSTPQKLLFTQYLPKITEAPWVQLRLACALGLHITLLGSMHAPKEHCVPAPQLRPHTPQFASSLATSLHMPSHAAPPFGHWHEPITHVAPVAQAFPQVPQFWTLLMTSLQTPSQAACPVGQRHAPIQQD
jgi:hypothetical protein